MFEYSKRLGGYALILSCSDAAKRIRRVVVLYGIHLRTTDNVSVQATDKEESQMNIDLSNGIFFGTVLHCLFLKNSGKPVMQGVMQDLPGGGRGTIRE